MPLPGSARVDRPCKNQGADSCNHRKSELCLTRSARQNESEIKRGEKQNSLNRVIISKGTIAHAEFGGRVQPMQDHRSPLMRDLEIDALVFCIIQNRGWLLDRFFLDDEEAEAWNKTIQYPMEKIPSAAL